MLAWDNRPRGAHNNTETVRVTTAQNGEFVDGGIQQCSDPASVGTIGEKRAQLVSLRRPEKKRPINPSLLRNKSVHELCYAAWKARRRTVAVVTQPAFSAKLLRFLEDLKG